MYAVRCYLRGTRVGWTVAVGGVEVVTTLLKTWEPTPWLGGEKKPVVWGKLCGE